MSDHFPAQIWIGGEISRQARLYQPIAAAARADDDDTTILQGLISALNDDGASHEYGDVAIDSDCSEAELMTTYLDLGVGQLHFKDDQARNGEFENTEAFCIEHGIPFDRNSDHYHEYDGENAYWRPGMDTPMITLANSLGNEIVSGVEVRKAMALLDGSSKPSVLNVDAVATVLVEVARLLHDACPPLPPDLEKFEIVV